MTLSVERLDQLLLLSAASDKFLTVQRNSWPLNPTSLRNRVVEYQYTVFAGNANTDWAMSTDQAVKMDSQPPDSMMTEWGVDLSPKQDKGVCKVIVRPGDEAEYPMTGDRVSVHYTGKLLNGKKFDSSRDRNEPFTFNLGRGQVIKAWDIGVASMKKGEVCQLMCHSEYAYGVSGSPPKIPPKSTLIFEIELLNFKGEELTEDGGVIRRIKQKGEGFSNPNEGAIVEVRLEGRSGGRVFDSRDVQFVVGEGEDHSIPLGVDRTMEKMQKGECCLIYLKPQYGFGDEGKPEFHIEPNAELVYQVTLKDFEKAKESWEMSIEEKLEQAVGVKQKGTQYFKLCRDLSVLTLSLLINPGAVFSALQGPVCPNPVPCLSLSILERCFQLCRDLSVLTLSRVSPYQSWSGVFSSAGTCLS
ncbi:UNVERIFIED_CONTAM: hypothetical protein FKN15_010720 [Acipenser sinensis]